MGILIIIFNKVEDIFYLFIDYYSIIYKIFYEIFINIVNELNMRSYNFIRYYGKVI